MGIVFDDKLKTGNKMIDTQHQELISRVNKLTDNLESNKNKMVAIQTLDFLMDYTEIHFAAEEKLQQEAEYPEYEAHRELHEEFKSAVDNLKDMLEEEEGPSDAFVEAVHKNIVQWLTNHIQVRDQKVADFVK